MGLDEERRDLERQGRHAGGPGPAGPGGDHREGVLAPVGHLAVDPLIEKKTHAASSMPTVTQVLTSSLEVKLSSSGDANNSTLRSG